MLAPPGGPRHPGVRQFVGPSEAPPLPDLDLAPLQLDIVAEEGLDLAEQAGPEIAERPDGTGGVGPGRDDGSAGPRPRSA